MAQAHQFGRPKRDTQQILSSIEVELTAFFLKHFLERSIESLLARQPATDGSIRRPRIFSIHDSTNPIIKRKGRVFVPRRTRCQRRLQNTIDDALRHLAGPRGISPMESGADCFSINHDINLLPRASLLQQRDNNRSQLLNPRILCICSRSNRNLGYLHRNIETQPRDDHIASTLNRRPQSNTSVRIIARIQIHPTQTSSGFDEAIPHPVFHFFFSVVRHSYFAAREGGNARLRERWVQTAQNQITRRLNNCREPFSSRDPSGTVPSTRHRTAARIPRRHRRTRASPRSRAACG